MSDDPRVDQIKDLMALAAKLQREIDEDYILKFKVALQQLERAFTQLCNASDEIPDHNDGSSWTAKNEVERLIDEIAANLGELLDEARNL